jgi:hypothetical protein
LQLLGSGTGLTFSAGGLPPGLGINSTTGLISGTMAAGAAAGGPYAVTVAASDGTHSTSQQFTWNANPKVSLTAPANQSTQEGQAVALQVQASESGATLRYSASGLPPGLSVNATTGLISGTVPAGAAAGGPYVPTVTASDGTYSSSATFNWAGSPAAAPAAPMLSNPGGQSSLAGESVALQVQATNPGGYPLTYSAVGLPDGLSIDPFAGLISGTVADDAASGTPYLVTVTADNGQGGTSSQTFLWSVQPAAIQAQGVAVAAVEGNDTGTVPVATFTTADLNSQAGAFTALVSWGDGTSDQGTVTGGAGSFVVTDDHVYAEKATQPVSVAIASPYGATATAYAQASVADAALNLTGGFDLGAVHQQTTTLTVATLSDGNPNATPADWTGTVNFGDGSGNQAATFVSLGGGLYGVSNSHSYAQDGTYTVTTTVTDKDGATATTTSTATVGDLYAGVSSQVYIGTFTDANGQAPLSGYTATITWGDGTQSAGTVTSSRGLLTVQGTHTYVVDSLGQPGGVYQVGVTITDKDGSTLTGSGTVEVVRPPVALDLANVAVGSGPVLTNVELASFTEPDASDAASEFTVTIDWGDGTPLDTTGRVVGANGLFDVLGSHTYAAAGPYTATVTLLQG